MKIIKNRNVDSFLIALQRDKFEITNDKEHIPAFIKALLDCYTNGFTIANPDQPYQAGDVISGERLPIRMLTFLAKSSCVLVMRYSIGGVGISSHLVLVKFENEKVIDFWKGICWRELRNIKDVVRYLKRNKNKNLWGGEDYLSF